MQHGQLENFDVVISCTASSLPIIGLGMVDAEPMTTATASSITLPRRIKSRKPFNIILISSFESRRQIAVYRLEQSVNIFEVPTRKSLCLIPRNYNCQRL